MMQTSGCGPRCAGQDYGGLGSWWPPPSRRIDGRGTCAEAADSKKDSSSEVDTNILARTLLCLVQNGSFLVQQNASAFCVGVCECACWPNAWVEKNLIIVNGPQLQHSTLFFALRNIYGLRQIQLLFSGHQLLCDCKDEWLCSVLLLLPWLCHQYIHANNTQAHIIHTHTHTHTAQSLEKSESETPQRPGNRTAWYFSHLAHNLAGKKS